MTRSEIVQGLEQFVKEVEARDFGLARNYSEVLEAAKTELAEPAAPVDPPPADPAAEPAAETE